MAIDTAQLADLLNQSLKQLMGPLKDMVMEIMGLGKATDKTKDDVKKTTGFIKLLGEGFPSLAGSLKGVHDWIDRIKGRSAGATAMGLAGSAVSAAQAPASMAKGLVGSLGGAASGITGTLQSIFGPLASMIDKINPNIVKMFEFAMDDLQAVFGELFAPIMEAAIPLIRKFADILQAMMPAFTPIIEVIVELFGIIGELLVPIFKAITPIIQLFGAILKALMPIIHFLAGLFTKLMSMFEWVIKGIISLYNDLANTKLGRLLGLKAINLVDVGAYKEGATFGKAIRETGYVGSEQLGKEARAKALRGGKTAEEKTAENTEKSAEELEKIRFESEATRKAMELIAKQRNPPPVVPAGAAYVPLF